MYFHEKDDKLALEVTDEAVSCSQRPEETVYLQRSASKSHLFKSLPVAEAQKCIVTVPSSSKTLCKGLFTILALCGMNYTALETAGEGVPLK